MRQREFEGIDRDNKVDQIFKKKNKLHRKIKRLLRAQKYAQQGEPIFEINFNRKDIAQSALNAPIKCGFEAETTWPNIQAEDDDGDWLEGKTWGEVADLIYDQEGQRSLDRIEEAYREWLQESNYFYNAESDVINELVVDRKEDEYYLDDYVSSKISETDIEDYREETLDRLRDEKDELESRAEEEESDSEGEPKLVDRLRRKAQDLQDDIAEREDWDMDAWGREYVEENEQDGFEEWLADEIRDNGEQWDDAWERAMEAADIDRYMEDEWGSWYDLLRSEDIFLVNEEAGGLEEVASRIEGWAENNSMSNDVRPGDYHSGSGVDNTYWRVESDSSIEGEGAGAEIISPVYDSPAEMLKEIYSLFEFLENQGVETNDSTGLHITMSWTQQDDTDTNKLKMALLLGDKYVAKQFDRERNSYTKSQMANIQRYINDIQNNIKDEKSLSALEEIISGGISDGKFSSINFKSDENEYGNDLIEFRVAGGYDYHNKIDTIAKTVIRYSAVMQAGHDPDAFRKDYVKALFRLITGKEDITTDDQRKAQQMINPDTINTRVLDAFQTLAGKKHYTDAIEQLGNAYAVLADVKALKAKNPQKELKLGEARDPDDAFMRDQGGSGNSAARGQVKKLKGEKWWAKNNSGTQKIFDKESAAKKFAASRDVGEDIDNPDYNAADDWREVLKTAQVYFIKAFTLLAIDVAAGANRAQPKAANIAALRGAIKEFGLDVNTIWDQMQKSKYLERLTTSRQSLAGSYYDKLERLAAAVNTLLKQQAVKAPDSAFELTIPQDHFLLMPKEKHTAAFGDLFGRTQPDPNATVSKDDFIVIDEDLYLKVQRARHQVQDSTYYVEAERERLEKYKQELKAEKKANNLVRANKIASAIDSTKVSISRYKEDAKYNQQIIDEFFKKYGFVPKGRRTDLEAIGPQYQVVRDDEIAALGPRFNIKVKTNGMSESVFDRFDKLPLTEQLKLVESIDTVKLDEIWNKKFKKEPEKVKQSDPFKVIMNIADTGRPWPVKLGDGTFVTVTPEMAKRLSDMYYKRSKIFKDYLKKAVKDKDNFQKAISNMSTMEALEEKWSKQFKDSIDCSNPKGFSQKAHCAGKKKKTNEENLSNCKHGKYYCSTDKKWKCRKGPKKSRNVSEGAGATAKQEDEFHTKLDKLVHKYFGHSSDEKKMKKKKTEATGVDHIKKSLVVATEMDTEWRGNKHRAVDMGKKVLGKYPAKMIKFSRSEYSLFVLDDENKPMMYFQLKNVGAGYIVSVSQLRKKYQGSGLGQKIYTSLVKDLGLTLVSDVTQSPGARKVWFNLANTPGVFVYAWNKNAKDPGEKFQQVTATDLGELETATGFAYDSEKGKFSVAGDKWQAVRKAKQDGANKSEITKISKEYDDEIGAMKKAKPVRLVATPQKGLSKKIGERKLSKSEIRTRDKYADDLPDKEFKKRYGKDWEAVKYGTATNMAKKKKTNESTNSFNKIKVLNRILSDEFPVGDLNKQLLAYQAIPVPEMLDAFRELEARSGKEACARPIVRQFVKALPVEAQKAIRLNESKNYIAESNNKEEAKELVQMSSTPSVLAAAVKYLKNLISKQQPTPADQMDQQTDNRQLENESIIREDVVALKKEAFNLIDRVKDEQELNALVAFLRKNEINELAHAAIEANISQGVKGGLDKKLGQMVMDVSGSFDDKEAFLKQLATGNGFWNGTDLTKQLTGNIYEKLKNNPIASELAKPMALELRGKMGYGPDQGPGEFLLALTGKGVDLADKSDLILVNGKGVEVKAEGWARGKKGITKSGGRLYSTSGYNGGTGAAKVLYDAMLEVGIPAEALAEYGWGVEREKGKKYPPLNFNAAGIDNINALLKKYTKAPAAKKLLNAIAEGFFLAMPKGMKNNFVNKSVAKNQIDYREAIHNFVALGHEYYKHQEGHDYIMIFNTHNGGYVMVESGEDMKRLLDDGALKLNSGMDFFDDRSKGTPQILVGNI